MSPKTRTSFAFGAALVLAASALTVAPVAAQEESALIFAIDGEVTALNNAADDVPTDEANEFLHSALYAYDESLTPVPNIAAELAEVSEDGKVWTIKLRDNATFMPENEPVTAEDVVFTYQLANSPNCTFNPSTCLASVVVTPEGASEPVSVLQDVQAIDETTVQFTLADAYAPFSTVSLPGLWIENKSSVEAAFARFQEQTADVSAADVSALLASMEGAEDLVPFRADAEAIVTAADLPLPDQTLFTGEDGALDEASYMTALRTKVAELSNVLNSAEIDQIAAAFKLLDTTRMPSSAGPFYVTEYRPGQDITAVRNDNYHWGPAQFERLFIPIIKDDVAASSALAGGDIDWKYSLTADGYAQLREAAGLKFALYPDFGYYGLQFNLRPGRLFADKPIRQALAYCIDKEATVEAATEGLGIPVYADIPPASWAYNPDVPKYEQNVELANQILDEAGWTMGDDGVRVNADGKRLETHILLRAGRPDRTRFMQLAADQAKDCGFNLTLEEADFASVLLPGLDWPHVMAGQSEMWDAYFGGWGASYDPDPYAIWHSSLCTNPDLPVGYNYICFQNERADELIEAGLKESDQAARAEIYKEFEAILADELPYLFAWSDEAREGLNVAVSGENDWTEEIMSSPTWFWELHKINKGGTSAPS